MYILQDISREAAQEDQAEQVLRICVLHTSEDEGASNADVSIVDRSEVLDECGNVAKDSLLLVGIIYAMN